MKDGEETFESMLVGIKTMDRNQYNEYLPLVINEIQNLREDVAQLRDLIHDVVVQNQDPSVDSDVPDNYDMTLEQVKETILEKVGLHRPFYPSDLSMKYGLDFDVVLEAVEILRQEGRIIE